MIHDKVVITAGVITGLQETNNSCKPSDEPEFLLKNWYFPHIELILQKLQHLQIDSDK